MHWTRTAVAVALVGGMLGYGARGSSGESARTAPTHSSAPAAPVVTPDSGNIVRPALGTPRLAVVFQVHNPGPGAERYLLRCVGEGGVSNCRLKESSVTVAAGASALVPVWYEATGEGWVRLEARARGTSDRGQYRIEPQPAENGGGVVAMAGPGGDDPPYAVFHPAPGFYSSPLNVLVEWCGPEATLDATSRNLTLNSTSNVTSNFSYSSTTRSGCTDAADSYGSITLSSGVYNYITGWICYETSEQQPELGPGPAAASSDCGGGQGGIYEVGSKTAPVVVLDTLNPGTRLDRSDCVISDAGPAAAFQCGDLIVTHSMPAYKALNKDQTLTLLYNSSTASIQPVVMANVYVTSGSLAPDNFQATLAIPSRSISQSFTFTASGVGMGSTNTRRLAVSLNDNSIPTGVYPYSLTVTNVYSTSCGSCSTTQWGDLIVVNRSASPYGAGWSLAGLEQIHAGQRDSAVLLVYGDGSAAVYEPISYSGSVPTAWRAPAGAYRDTIFRAASPHDSLYYHRTRLDGTRHDYNAAGLQVWVKGQTGQKVQYAWTSNTSPTARLSYVRIAPHARDLRYALAYDGASALDYITDPAGRVLQTTVSSGALVDLLDPGLSSSNKVQYGYTSGLMTSRTSARGYTASYSYNSRTSQLVTATMPTTSAGTAVLTYRPIQGRGLWQSTGTATIAAAQARVVVDGPRAGADSAIFWVRGSGAPYKMQDPAGATTTIDHGDPVVPALPTLVTWQNTRRQKFKWFANGTLEEMRDSLPAVDGIPTAVTTFQYASSNARGRPTLVTDPVGLQTRYSYRADGQVDSVVTPASHVTTFGYYESDGSSGLASQLRSVAELNVPVWNWSLVQDVNDSTRHTFTYDSVGNLKTQTTPRGGTTTLYRDAKGRVSDVYDPLNHRNSFTYDDLNRLLTSTHHDTGSTYTSNYSYNAEYLETAADPRNVSRIYYYDALGRLNAETSGNYGEYRSYDLAGNLDRVITRMGDTIRYVFDDAGRLRKRSWPAVDTQIPADSAVFFYDIMGQVDSAKTGIFKVVRTYYGNGLLKYEQQGLVSTGGSFPYSHRYWYDAARRRTRYAIGGSPADTVSYAYASSGDLRYVAVRWRNSVRDSVVFGFDGLGRRKQLVYSPTASYPVTVNLAYDANSNMVRLCSQQGGSTGDAFRFRFARTSIDLEDKVTYISTSDDAACSNVQYPGNETFAYDTRHQVTQHNSTYYEYDASGNRTREILGGTNKVFEMVDYRNQLARSFYVGQPDTMQYTYDYSGSLIVEQGRGAPYAHRYYFYDSLNRISGVSDYGNPNRTGAPNTCQYDAMGVIRQPCEGGLGASTLTIGYDGPNTVRTGPDNSQTASWTFVHGPGVDDPLMGYFDGAPIYIYYVTDGAGRQYGVGENTGYAVTDPAYRHYRFAGGITRSETFGAERQAPSSSPGLSLFRNRMYDQATGRWTQEDPIGIAGGINLYQYAGNNPATYTDPFGLCPWCIGGAGGVATGYVLAKLTGSEYDLKDAAVDFALGAAGAGIVSKLDKINDARKGLRATAHGADRLADASRLGHNAAQEVIDNATRRLTQSDGAKVFVQEIDGRFNVVVTGERGVITNFKNLSERSLNRLARNYGWQ